MATQPTHSFKADLLLFGTTFIASAGWIFSKETLVGMPPLLFIGARFLLAGLLLSVLSIPHLRAIKRTTLGGPLLVGVLFAAAMALWVLGLAHSSHIGEGAFIFSMSVVLVPVFARLFFGEHPPLSTWLALPISMTGFACLLLEHGFQVEPGQLFYLGAALLFALLYNINARVLREVSARALSSIQMLVVGSLILPAALLLEPVPGHVSLEVLGWFTASAFLATTFRFFLQMYGQSLTTPSHTAIIMMFEPMLTAITAAWWYGETMGVLQVFGCLLIFFALIVSRWYWIRSLLRNIL